MLKKFKYLAFVLFRMKIRYLYHEKTHLVFNTADFSIVAKRKMNNMKIITIVRKDELYKIS